MVYRIVYGSVEDTYIHQRQVRTTYREGWWWVFDGLPEDGLPPYSPEGPFVSKRAATRHLIQHFANGGDVNSDFIGWAKTRCLKRRTLRPAIKHMMLTRRDLQREIASSKLSYMWRVINSHDATTEMIDFH